MTTIPAYSSLDRRSNDVLRMRRLLAVLCLLSNAAVAVGLALGVHLVVTCTGLLAVISALGMVACDRMQVRLRAIDRRRSQF